MVVRAVVVAICAGLASLEAAGQATAIHGRNGVTLGAPPVAAVKPVTETVGGQTLTDSYRWLEDRNSPETSAFLREEMTYTNGYYAQLEPLRARIVARLAQLERVEESGVPEEREGALFFTRRPADENQASIFMRPAPFIVKGGAWVHPGDVRLIDARPLSADANASVHIAAISKKGDLLVYGIRHGGADEETVRVFNVPKRMQTGDDLPLARYAGFGLTLDGRTLFYAKVLEDGSEAVFQHTMGTPVEKDTEIFGGTYKDETLGPLDLVGCEVSDNGHWLIVEVSHGVPATREDILVKDLRKPDAKFEPLVYGVDARFALHMSGDHMFVKTDYNAPNGRVLEGKLGDPSTKSWRVVIPEGTSAIDEVSIADGEIFVARLADVKTQTTIYSLHGRRIGEIRYPGIGTGSVVSGYGRSDIGYYTFSSFTIPETIYQYNVATHESSVWFRPEVPFDSSQYEVRQVFYTSKDGTRVPMFIAGRKGLAMDGTASLLMTGYGGFDISMTPGFNPEYAWWMEQGGFFALPNLRGGGEYGEKWHEAGMFEHKQNVFDDWFAAAQYLLANHYTTPQRFAITGRSNGGLLMGASMTQRPDLFGAIVCGYPLLDMSRYQKFLVGRWWTTEYGSAEKPDQAAYILKYSPYQNIRQGVKYPAILFVSGDSDTRVDPLHARKMAAAMQATVMAEPEDERRPVLLHYDTHAGHSAGVSLQQKIRDTADELTFLWNETGGK
ncbi:MAG TPA: prolyl oligopeptidase family serine peptidase [Acidobacteriaceae bacterium]|jgi:prolyl oligopeptidase|nr:prolyl oligopeptidase family serine peptidase [Acidobacteriaceae bacterium]